ncbi:MAG: NAD(P)/FAD-dependent oxidoreductase [Candidatus Nanopelagicales bacterium]|nr:NAD(P)/FAD-dependent oxidoreductase [Candidatus Nanopelagicales bacterium]MCF8540096.1 NAD(P)/FAD-dependent oxidoreductase [Candidatus Nanopelagicales bacterium]
MTTASTREKVLIVGAGFGGLTCATKLAKSGKVDVTVVDRHPYQLFAPLLYQVATGGLPEDDIAYPVRAAIPGVDFIRGDVVKVSLEANNIRLEDGRVLYFDQLVFAVGSEGTTFGIPGVAENALQMKNIREARAIRHRLLQTYEDVETGAKPKEALRVVVVGGGPTGVEVTGAVSELQRSMHREFPDIAGDASVTLVEAAPRLLMPFNEKSSAHAKEELEELGAVVKVNAAVDRMYPTDVHLKSGEVLTAGTIIWAAGVAAPPQWSILGETDRANRLKVSDTLQLNDNVWVIGDMAHVVGEGDRPLPMVASVAMQQGRYVAASIEKKLNGESIQPFVYKDKGQMATIGRRRAVVELPNGLRLHGTPAWMSWLALHVFYLAGGRNRVSVIADWFWNYIAWGIGPRRTVIE